MSNGSGVTLEGVHAEVEKLGGVIRGLSMQIAGMRSRVADLEQWDVPLLTMGKKKKKRGKGKGKGKKKGKGTNGKGGGYKRR